MKKEHKTWIIVDVKSGKFRVLSPKISLKNLKSKLKHTEIPIDLTLNVDVPETPILKAQGEIKLSQVQISELLLSEIEEDDEDGKQTTI
jgi:hypothetical protein